MSREITNVLSTGLDIYNCVICLFMIASIYNSNIRKKDKASLYLICVCISVFIINLADIPNWIAEGNNPSWHVPLLHSSIFIFYCCTPAIILFLICYIQEHLRPSKVDKKFFRITLICDIFYFIGVLISPINGFFFTFTPDNYYVRGKYNFIAIIFYAIFYAISVWMIIENRKQFTKKALFSFLSYSFFPIITEFIQIKYYGLALVNTGMTFSILLIFMNTHQDLLNSYEKSEKEIRLKEKKMIDFQEHTIASLSNLVENRDSETGEHAQRTSLFVQLLAYQVKKDNLYSDILTDEYLKLMIKSAPMHDIGKIVVSDLILKKTSKLTPEEFEKIKEHAREGGKIIRNIIGYSDDFQYVQVAVDMAQSHHEWWDGTGYPNNLKGEEIPLCARIMAIADVFDALVFERCYKKPMSQDDAFEIIKSESGTHFDPVLVEEFMKVKDQIFRMISN